MDKKKIEKDWLQTLFSRMPEGEPLPASFRQEMMKRIMAESLRIKKRNERLALLSVILASLGMMGLAVGALWYIGFPSLDWEWTLPELTSLPFYLYIGSLSLLLLLIDHACRRRYQKKRQHE
ncbi:MAG: hypothetical protein LBQ65_01720 [Tannerellaceae bacterium]|jgi:hypothetical protein|nr:hypothetical protein [Tannerellaceae bacterium]